MCKEWFRIKSKSEYGIKEAYIPCGKCSDCRKAKKSEWINRAKAEIEEYHMNRNYNVGFITLTYHDKALPTIPKKFLIDKNEKIPCFNYEHIKKFIQTIKKHLFDKYKLTDGYRYIITSEYGEKHHRPHYHGLLMWHPKISHETMYQIIQDAWTGTTHQIKNNKKRHTKRWRKGIIGPYKDFIPRDTYACGGYVAKYICKDIEFEESTKDKLVKMSKKWKNELRHYQPFHKQSMSFGKKITENKEDRELIEILKNGLSITGNPKREKAAKYIQEKILYTTQKKYNLNTHKWETVKKYTKFFHDNKKEIYIIRLEKNRKILEDLTSESYYKIHQIDDISWRQQAPIITKNIRENHTTKELAEFYTLYFGRKYERCKIGKPEELYFSRYNPCADLEELPQLNKEYYDQMSDVMNELYELAHLPKTTIRTEQEEKDEEIRAFWEQYRQNA